MENRSLVTLDDPAEDDDVVGFAALLKDLKAVHISCIFGFSVLRSE